MPRPKAARFESQRAAIAASRRYCRNEWARISGLRQGPGSAWTPTLERWFKGAALTKQLEVEANSAFGKIEEALAAIERFEQLLRHPGATAEPLLLGATFLKRWLGAHHGIFQHLRSFPGASIAATPRQFVLLRAETAYPQHFDPLRAALKRVDWTDTTLAAVSLLVGNEPQISRAELNAGITAAAVLQIEVRHIRSARRDLAKKMAVARARKGLLKP